MQLSRIIQRKKTALHPPAVRELFHYRRNVPPSALHTSGGVEFRKEANEHALSLPSTTTERKKNTNSKAAALSVQVRAPQE